MAEIRKVKLEHGFINILKNIILFLENINKYKNTEIQIQKGQNKSKECLYCCWSHLDMRFLTKTVYSLLSDLPFSCLFVCALVTNIQCQVAYALNDENKSNLTGQMLCSVIWFKKCGLKI